MHIGKRILKCRLEHHLSQQELAKGIISSTYLCNIENGRYEANKEILQLLARRLQVPPAYLASYHEKDPDLEEHLNLLEESLETNTEEAETRIQWIQREYPFIPSILQELRFCLLAGICGLRKNEVGRSEAWFRTVQALLDNPRELPLNLQEKYYYFSGVLHYHLQDYQKSLLDFLILLSITKDPKLIPRVKYNLALNLTRLNQYTEAIRHATDALNTYLIQELNFAKAADCYAVLGVLYQKKSDLDHAIEFYQNGLKMAEQTGSKHLLGILHHNLGLVYRRKKSYDLALSHLQKSLDHLVKDKAITYAMIIDVRIDQGTLDEIPDLIAKAKAAVEKEYEGYYLKAFEAKYFLKKGQEEDYEDQLQSVIEYFHKEEHWCHALDFSRDYAAYCEHKRRYKRAAKYLKIALEANMKLQKGGLGP